MSTALLYCGMSEGFVIGADSRGFNLMTQQVETDRERKIFICQHSSATVVFAWAGTVKARTLGFEFSLIEESNSIIPKADIRIFGEDFNTRLRERLSLLGANTTGELARGVFLYFWKGVAMGFEVSVFKNGRTWDSHIIGGGTPNGEVVIVSGCSETAEFERPRSLNQAKGMIEDYIRACIADSQSIDIGGDVHIGRLAPDGFSWMIPLE